MERYLRIGIAVFFALVAASKVFAILRGQVPAESTIPYLAVAVLEGVAAIALLRAPTANLTCIAIAFGFTGAALATIITRIALGAPLAGSCSCLGSFGSLSRGQALMFQGVLIGISVWILQLRNFSWRWQRA